MTASEGVPAEVVPLHAGTDIVDRLLAGAPVGFAFYDTDYRYVRINEVLARINGVPAIDHIGRTTREVVPTLADVVEAALQHVLDTGESILNQEVTGPSPDDPGELMHWVTSWYPTRGANGGLVGVAVVAVDVTEQKAVEQQLRRSEARYRSLVESAALDVWRTDAQGLLVSDMPQWRELTGQDASQIGGTGWLAGVHPAERDWVWQVWQECVRSRQPYDIEYRIGAADQWRTVRARGVPVVEGGAVVEWVGTTTDVTELRGVEALRETAYGKMREAALTLQRSILPDQTPELEELDVCARYIPGVEDAEVGGDWYDVIPLGAGRVGLVVGDVMGRGIAAAAVMGRLRTAVRAYARLDLPPGELLDLLDGLVGELEDDQIVTCVYGVYDPGAHVLSYASAGHLPPVVRRPERGTSILEGPAGAPLGTGAGVFPEQQVSLPPGSLVALYTDGLVESPDTDIDDGIAAVAAALEPPVDGLSARCDLILDRLGRRHGHQDDVALLVVSVPDGDGSGSQVSRLHVPRGIQSVADVRARCEAVFAEWRLDPETAEAALLVVNELVTNALVHGRGEVDVALRRTPTRLFVEVADGSGHLPRRRLASSDDESGRGLLLVAALCDRWGVRPLGEGKVVWSELGLTR